MSQVVCSGAALKESDVAGVLPRASNRKHRFEAAPSPQIVTLTDGTAVTIRPIRPDDAPRLQALLTRLSPESIYFRFHGLRTELRREDAERLARVDYETSMALVGAREERGKELIIAVARYAACQRAEPGLAEAAIVVEDRYQGLGLGTLLLERLAAYGRAHGVHTFLAEVQFENARMMQFIRRSGLPAEMKIESGVWEIRVHLAAAPDSKRGEQNDPP